MIDEEEVYAVAVDLLRAKADKYESSLRALLEFEQTHEGMFNENSPTGVAWEPEDCPVSPQKIVSLWKIGLLHIVHKTNKYKVYCLAHPDQIRRALEPMDRARQLAEVTEVEKEPVDLDQLFTWIVGYDEIKFWVKKALVVKKPVHIALEGPPGSGKTAFLMDIHRIPGARFVTGAHMTKAGLWEVLAYEQPDVLCIDEFEKLSGDDYNLLYTLLPDGFIQKDMSGEHVRIELNTRVFVAVNVWSKVPEGIRRRFKHWGFKEYTEEEFRRIAAAMLQTVEGVAEELATYIAEVVARFSRDIRETIRYARLCEDRKEVDLLFATDLKYNDLKGMSEKEWDIDWTAEKEWDIDWTAGLRHWVGEMKRSLK